jgi:hypothetical protein
MTLRVLVCRSALVAVVLLPAVGTASASAARTYPDLAGDLFGRAGPDIVSVAVAHTATTITFRVRFAKAPPLMANPLEQWLDVLAIALDVPPKGPAPTPSGWKGADYSAGALATQTTGTLTKGPGWRRVATFKLAVSGRTMTLSIPRRRVGNPAWFHFVVAAGREGGVSDSSPDRGSFRYVLAG